MNKIDTYLINAEEAAIERYLNDTLYEYDDYSLEMAFEDAAAATVSVSATSTEPVKKKFSLWEWVKGIITKIGNVFKKLFGLAKDTENAVEHSARELSDGFYTSSGNDPDEVAQPLENPADSDTRSDTNQLRSVKPKGSASIDAKTIRAIRKNPPINRLNTIRIEYANAAKNAVKVVFTVASASCKFMDAIRSTWHKPTATRFTSEFSRIDELYTKAQYAYSQVQDSKASFDEIKNTLGSLKKFSKQITPLNINDAKETCKTIEAACKKHYEWCDNFVTSVDNAAKKYGESASGSEKNTYAAAKQYLKVAALANNITAAYRKCAADVYCNGN